MIPVGLYNRKIESLSKVLDKMGNTPENIMNWLGDQDVRSTVQVAMLKSAADQSVALIESMPKFEGTTLLGLKLTEPTRVDAAKEILHRDRARVFDEINNIETIRNGVHLQWERLKTRLWAVRYAKDIYWDTAREGGEGAAEAWQIVDEIERIILPVLVRLRDELYRAVRMCDREIRLRADRVEAIDDKQLSIPKYNRRARRKRKARAAAAAAVAAAETATEDKGKGGGGKN